MKKDFRQKYKNTCNVCGKQFFPFRRNQPTCSRTCGARFRKGNTAKTSQKKYNTQCVECGKPLYRKQYLINKSRNQFCSRSCLSLYKRKAYAGKFNPNFQNSGEKICLNCNSIYITYNKNRKFCSVRCSYEGAKSSSARNAFIGSVYEKKCAKKLTSIGYHSTLSQSSRGKFDVIAISEKEILLIQVKFSKRIRNVGLKKHCEKLLKIKVPQICRKQLWVYISGKGWFITEVNKNGKRNYTHPENFETSEGARNALRYLREVCQD